MVKVIAGDGKSAKEFFFHRNLLACVSSYFKIALQEDRFKEGIEGIIHLDQDDPETVGLFMDWLYDGDRIIIESGREQYKKAICSKELYDLYIFADFRGVPALKNRIVDVFADLLARTWSVFPTISVARLYENIPHGSGLTRLMATFVVMGNVNVSEMATHASLQGFLLQEFWVDVAVAFYKHKHETTDPREQWCKMDLCAFHDHGKPRPKITSTTESSNDTNS